MASSDRPESLQPLVLGSALALAVASIFARTLTTGAGLELHAPGAQILFDALTLCAAFALALARLLAGERPLGRSGWPLLALLVVSTLLCASAARAPNADLAWRTALSWSAAFLLAVTARDLARDRPTARLLLSVLVGCVATGAALGLYEYFVEQPERLAQLEAGALDAELAVHGRSFAIAAKERLRSRAAVGPYVLPGLLATAILAVLPAAAVALRRSLKPASDPSQELAQRSAGSLGAAAAVLLLGLGLVLTQSKGAVVTALGVGCVLALTHPALRRWRPKLRLLFAAGAAFVLLTGGVAWAVGPERIGVGLSFQVRLEYWQTGLAMWSDHPLLGVGLNGYRELFSVYKPARAEEALHAHNALVQVLAELGLVGLLGLGSLVACWGWIGARALTRPADDEPADAEPASRATRGAVGAGLALGALLVAGHGDLYNALPEGRGHLLFAVLAVPTLTAGLAYAFARPGSRRLLGAAALAGASALLWDGALNFGLHQAGVLTIACCLAGLAPALAGVDEHLRLPRRLAAGLMTLLAGVSLLVLLGLVPTALTADGERELARAAHGAGVAALQAGRTDEALVELSEAARAYASATELYPREVRTWIEQAGALDALSRIDPDPERRSAWRQAALASAQRAAELDPWAADVWHELGRLWASSDRERSAEAYEEATRRYPTHPTYRLDAAHALAELADALSEAPRQATLRARAREHLARALENSQTTRLVRIKLSPEQLERARALSARLSPDG